MIDIAKEGYPYIILSLFTGVVFWTFFPVASFVAVLVAFALAWFFRDPVRTTSVDTGAIISPADGKIVSIESINENRAKRISIYLSLFDVHINRAPVSGTVKNIVYTPGSFFAAFKNEARRSNENNLIGFDCSGLEYKVRQVAGSVARKIVCNCREGQQVVRGEKIGMIKFGSCVQLEVPDQVGLQIKIGDKVKAGETIIGVV